MKWDPEWKIRAIRQISFNCARCGRCCVESALIDVYPEDVNRMARRFHCNMEKVVLENCEEHPLGGRRFMLNGVRPCKFYRDGCRIYHDRPLICRMAPFLAGKKVYCDVEEMEVPDMDDSALMLALGKMSGVSTTEMVRYLRMIGAIVDG